jgi:prepilin-type N-terminal cleavage/methylation domain-containing protein
MNVMNRRFRPSTPRRRTRARAFTLIEILVVIGIMVLLASITLPMVLKAYRAGDRTRMAADLNAIANALEQYRVDFGDYPRFDPTDNRDYRGAQVLCKALVGPAPATFISSTLPPNHRLGSDGADGPGFRLRRLPGPDTNFLTTDDVLQGKVHGPYLQPDKFPIGYLNNDPANLDYSKAVLLDRYRNPILYFVANPKKPNLTTPNSYLAYTDAATPWTSLYNLFDNYGDLPATEIKIIARRANSSIPQNLDRMRIMLGDFGDGSNGAPNGMIDSNETAATTAAFIFGSAGADNEYGPNVDPATIRTPTDARRVVSDCDDVTTIQK